MAVELWFKQWLPEHEALYFNSPHYVHIPGGNDKHLVILTGIAKFEFFGDNSGEWREADLYLGLKFPPVIPLDKAFSLEHWAPLVTVNSIDKGGDNHDGGWDVADFSMMTIHQVQKEPVRVGDPFTPQSTEVGCPIIYAHLWVRGALFRIFRVSYSLTMSGQLINRGHPE